jgi:hypothetical protein
MAQTITPVVHGGRRARWLGSVLAHAAGGAASAAVMGAALGGLGGILGAPWGRTGLVALAAVAGAYAARELLGIPIPLPNLRRQVPEWWRTFFSPPVAAFLYGAGLGVGFLTFLSFGTLVAVSAAALVSGSPATGALLVGPFGLARGLSVLVAAKATDQERLERLAGRMERMAVSRAPAMVNGIALLAVTIVAAVAAVASVAVSGSVGAARSGPAAAAVATVFAWAAVAKILRPAGWRTALEAYGLGAVRTVAMIAVPALELGVVVLIATGHLEAGATAALAMLGAFTLAVLRARRLNGDRLACGCFGRSRVRDYRVILARNAGAAALAAFALAGHGTTSTFPLRWPGNGELLPASLSAAGLVLAGVVVRAAVRSLTARDNRSAA